MTTTDFPHSATTVNESSPDHHPSLDAETPPIVAALQRMIFGDYWPLHERIAEVVAGLGDRTPSGLTYSQETLIAQRLLRRLVLGVGRPAGEIAADHQLRGALCDAAQVLAPRVLLILTGNFSLSTSAINRLGNGSRYQQDCLADLDSGETVGLLCLTELGGTNGADHQTIAEWDPHHDGFWISTPRAEAWKFMPNAASERPKTAVVTARLLVDGVDEGVFPFLLRLRSGSSAGLAQGVEATPLPEKSSAPMDHGIFRFTRVWVPREALLGGDWARMTPDGRFECDVPLRSRFHRAIAVLGDGRLDLANAAIASARAALKGLVNYSGQRRPGEGTLMADRDNVQLDLVTGVATALAASVLGRRIRDFRTNAPTDDHAHGLWSMLAKPLLSEATEGILTTCQQLAGAQGHLRSNLIPDWIENTRSIITAEGDNKVLKIKAGTPAIEYLRLPHTPERLPWYLEMLIHREHRIAVSLGSGSLDPASTAMGLESAAAEMTTATSQRLAATALYLEAIACTDPDARRLAESATTAYALQCILSEAAWYIAHPDMPRVPGELRRHRLILCDHLTTMVEAFGVPDLSDAPIFSDNYIEKYRELTGWED